MSLKLEVERRQVLDRPRVGDKRLFSWGTFVGSDGDFDPITPFTLGTIPNQF